MIAAPTPVNEAKRPRGRPRKPIVAPPPAAVTEPRVLLAGDGFLTVAHLAELFQVGQDCIWRWVRAGHFPTPIKLGENTTRWACADVRAWIASKGSK